MNAIQKAFETIAMTAGVLTLFNLAIAAVLYIRSDRSGDSGRHGHYLDNSRLDGPDETVAQPIYWGA